jgi:two-component system NtrC family sensor kinase
VRWPVAWPTWFAGRRREPPDVDDAALSALNWKHISHTAIGRTHVAAGHDGTGPIMNTNRSILLIEDSDTQALLLSSVLEQEGMSVHRAGTAEEGLEYLRSNRPTLVVVDYHLPGMQGDEFCRLIRDNSATDSIPLLILTEDTESNVEQHGLDCGADDYVAKSTDSDVLLARIELLLRRSHARSIANARQESFFKAQQILVVDDSPTYLALLEEELTREGYGVLSASTGEAALDIIKHQQVDCLVLDLVMPGMDGIELCRRVNELREHAKTTLPILMVTGRGSKEKMMEALEVGADDFVEKSNDGTVLKARIRALLRRKIMHDEQERIHRELRSKELELVSERAERKAAQARARMAEQIEIANRELEHANRELKEAHVQLLQSAKMASLGELVAGIAHEVNNPLAYSMSHLGTISAALDTIATEIEAKLTKTGASKLQKARQRAKDVHEGLTRVQDLMTKLRTFSRLDEGTFKVADLRECVESALPLIQHRLNEGIRVKTEYAADNEIYCAPGLINQVVLNLLTNAIDAVGENGHIVISTWRENNEFCLAVADSGPGILPELHERIFEPFFTTKDVGKGTGMGLAICYRIIERHRGRIEIGTSDMGGAVLALRIPLNLAEIAHAA